MKLKNADGGTTEDDFLFYFDEKSLETAGPRYKKWYKDNVTRVTVDIPAVEVWIQDDRTARDDSEKKDAVWKDDSNMDFETLA